MFEPNAELDGPKDLRRDAAAAYGYASAAPLATGGVCGPLGAKGRGLVALPVVRTGPDATKPTHDKEASQ